MNWFSRIFDHSPKTSMSFFHEFHRPPYGGGNQFLLALKKELESRNIRIKTNKIGPSDTACLINSYNFNFSQIEKAKNKYFELKIIHRVDGPIGVYRGADDGVDSRIVELNNRIANATILQSHYSFKKHMDLGFNFINPVVIPNAADPTIFHSLGRIDPPDGNRKIRIVASAWSDNPRKGGPLYQWLDEHLDHTIYDFFFVGRCNITFKRIKHIAPLPSEQLAELLRSCDIYVTASMDDPCSNSLIEALTCGLPVVYRLSGGHPELVGEAGMGFADEAGCLEGIQKVADNYPQFQSKIKVLGIKDVADKYLHILQNNYDNNL